MKQPEKNSADALQLPASSTVELFGRVIPVTDYVTVGEAIELEALLDRQDVFGLEQNVEAVAILIKHRLGEPVTAADLLGEPLPDLLAFEEGVNVLMSPFSIAYTAASVARRARAKAAIQKALMAARPEESTGGEFKLN